MEPLSGLEPSHGLAKFWFRKEANKNRRPSSSLVSDATGGSLDILGWLTSSQLLTGRKQQSQVPVFRHKHSSTEDSLKKSSYTTYRPQPLPKWKKAMN